MTREELIRYLAKQGFKAEQAVTVADTLINKWKVSGRSEEEVLAAISADLSQDGPVAQRLQELKRRLFQEEAVHPAITSSASGDIHTLKGSKNDRTSVILSSELVLERTEVVVERDKKRPSAEVPPLTKEEAQGLVESGRKARTSKARSFFSRHKKVFGVVAVVLVALVLLGSGLEWYYKRPFSQALSDFDRTLNLESQESVESSLDQLQIVIETAGTALMKLGRFNQKAPVWIFTETEKRLKRFFEEMETKAAGQDEIYGRKIRPLFINLGRGMHWLFLSIRNEEAKFTIKRRMLYAVDPKEKGWDPDFLVARGFYLSYDAGAYQPSSQMKIVKKGGVVTLERLSKKDKAARALVNDPLYRAQNEIRFLQMQYYTRHHARFCGDLRELLDEYLKNTSGGGVSPETVALIRNGALAVKLSDEGRSYELLDLRKN